MWTLMLWGPFWLRRWASMPASWLPRAALLQLWPSFLWTPTRYGAFKFFTPFLCVNRCTSSKGLCMVQLASRAAVWNALLPVLASLSWPKVQGLVLLPLCFTSLALQPMAAEGAAVPPAVRHSETCTLILGCFLVFSHPSISWYL